MATKINATRTTDINFDKDVTYENNFADWLTKMVSHWSTYSTGCTYTITKVGTESEGLTAEITTATKPNEKVDCKTSLYNDLKELSDKQKITFKDNSTGSQTIYAVTWKKGSTTNKNNNDGNDGDGVFTKGPGKTVSRLFGGVADTVMSGIQTGLKAFGEGDENNFKLLEEIDRIKELIK